MLPGRVAACVRACRYKETRVSMLRQLGRAAAEEGLLDQSVRAHMAEADLLRSIVQDRPPLPRDVIAERLNATRSAALQAVADGLDGMGCVACSRRAEPRRRACVC